MSAAGNPTTVALLSPCGWGNLGDAAIMTAAIDQIRARRPEGDVIAITLNPIDTQQRHGIPAFAIDAFTLAGFSVDRAGLTGVRRVAQRVLQRIRRVSCRVTNALCDMLNWITLPIRELSHWWSSYRVVRRCECIVVCGGGQIDELWGGPWGHPYVLFKFAFLSRLTGARFVVLSSGSAKLTSRLGRWFVRRALRLADYRSFREHFAVNLARELGAPEPNLWFPDLAFSLDVSSTRPVRRGKGPIVGVSPIAWLDPNSWPEKDGQRYDDYFSQLVEFLRALVKRKNQVVLFATAAADHAVIADLVRVLCEDGIADLNELVMISAARTVPDLFNVVAQVDVVVASRLHGVLLCYACCLPVAAVSYDPKVDYLVESFHQEDACLPIFALEASQLLTTLDRVYATREAISQQLAAKVAAFRELLAQQYDRVFGPLAVEESGHAPETETSAFAAEQIA
ncbi:MAG TPA: polysaccharide pyruvyl transferase family protein [Planctomycetaceae bacterium]|nr:polysaccharide pyruvyl transferase family protein [Planctomycetaceae bacterium]